jgi:hypothetical protein
VVLLGDEELATNQASVRDMRARDQISVPLDDVVASVAPIALAVPAPGHGGEGGAPDTGASDTGAQDTDEGAVP